MKNIYILLSLFLSLSVLGQTAQLKGQNNFTASNNFAGPVTAAGTVNFTGVTAAQFLGIDSDHKLISTLDLSSGTNWNIANVNNAAGRAANLTNTANQFSGTFTGNVVATNLTFLTTNLISPTGVDDTANIQAAAAIPYSLVKLAPKQTYYVSTVHFTNFACCDGQEATVKLMLTGTNATFDCGISNVCAFWDIHFDGQQNMAYNSIVLGIPLNSPEIFSSFMTNRFGLRFNAGGGGFVRNCSFDNYSGVGLLVYNWYGTEAYRSENAPISDCVASHNFISYFVGNGQWDGTPHYSGLQGSTSNNNPSSFAYNSPEYQLINNCLASSSCIGFNDSAGNSKMLNCNAVNCYVGGYFCSGPNAGHGLNSNNTFNHNTYGVALEGFGTQFNNDIFLSNTASSPITGVSTMTFIGCKLNAISAGVPQLTLSAPNNGVGSVTIENCGGGNITNIISVTSSNAYVKFYANLDASLGDDGASAYGYGFMTNDLSAGVGRIYYPYSKIPTIVTANTIDTTTNGTMTQSTRYTTNLPAGTYRIDFTAITFVNPSVNSVFSEVQLQFTNSIITNPVNVLSYYEWQNGTAATLPPNTTGFQKFIPALAVQVNALTFTTFTGTAIVTATNNFTPTIAWCIVGGLGTNSLQTAGTIMTCTPIQ